jgi:hypothetical protein
MPYHIPAESITLETLKERILTSHLVPSRSCLKTKAENIFSKIAAWGITNLAELRKALHTKSKQEKFAAETQISIEYLTLLRREMESWFPKAIPMKEFAWLSAEIITALEQEGVINTEILYLLFEKDEDKMSQITGIDKEILKKLKSVSDLCRVQWTNATAAEMLLLAGIDSAQALADSDAEILYTQIDDINRKYGFFKGKIGQSDIRRWIFSASWLPKQLI